MRRASLALRTLAIVLIAVAPWLPDGDRPDDTRSVMLVVDDSFSVGPSATATADAFVEEALGLAPENGARVGVVRVADQAVLLRPVGGERRTTTRPPLEAGTALADGVRLARAGLPQSGSRRIVLMTDGRGTRGDARREIEAARSEGITVDVLGIGTPPVDRTELGDLRPLQRRVATGESVQIAVDVHGHAQERVLLEHYRDGERVARRWVRLDDEGALEETFVDHEPPAGMHVYESQLVASDGSSLDRTRRRAAVLVSGKPKVLVVTLLGDQPTLLVDAIRQADADVEHLQLTEGRLDAARLSGVDLVVLSDLPLERAGEVSLVSGLGDEAQRALVDFVSEQGGGLVVTGGAFGFGPDYAGTPLARILPIRIEDQGEVDDPPVAMAVMLDRSGSMGARVGAHSKMELAVEASLAAAATLRSTDRIAIASVDVASTWAQRLEPAAALVPRRDRVRSIRAGGGGIYVYTALVDAYRELEDAGEPIRHVILFSDTQDSEEQWQGCPFRPCRRTLPYAVDLARDARFTGVTTSVVGIGHARDVDTRFLQDLAAAGGGRFYLTTRGSDLRRIFVTETRAAALSNLREEPMAVRRSAPSPMIDGLGEVPDVSGFVLSQVRPTADTALVTGEGQPILASWRYGLGTVVALTTDAGGRWTESWNEWGGAGQMMRQVVRFAQRRRAPTEADVRLELDGETMILRVDVPLESDVVPGRVELFAHAPDGTAEPVEVDLERVAPGRFEARAQAPSSRSGAGPAVGLARVRDDRGRLLGEAVAQQSASGEFAAHGPDEALLGSYAAAGGGVRDPQPGDVLTSTGDSTPLPVPVWPWVLLIAALLVTIDLWLRRFEKAKTGTVDITELMPRSVAGKAAEPEPEPEDISEAA